MDLFRALRDQGRDRVGQLCAWKQGKRRLLPWLRAGRRAVPARLRISGERDDVRRDHRQRGRPTALASPRARLVPGPRASGGERQARARDGAELAAARPVAIGNAETLDDAVDMLTSAKSGGRTVNEREAKAALVVALALGWIAFEN